MKITQKNQLSLKEMLHLPIEKSVVKLTQGQVFKAQIVDIQRGRVLLLLDEGTFIEAKLQNQILEMKIGQMMFFKVQSNSNDQVLIEVLKNQSENPKLNMILEALDAANLFADSDNIKMVEAFLEHQLPIDRRNLQEISYQLKSHPSSTIEELLFLLKNELPIDEKHISQLKAYVGHTLNLEKQVEQLMKAIGDIEHHSFKAEVLRAFIRAIQPDDTLHHSLNHKDSTNEDFPDLSRIYREIEVLTYLKDHNENLLNDEVQKEVDFHISTDALSDEIKSILSKDKDILDFFINELKRLKKESNRKGYLENLLFNKEKEFFNIMKDDMYLSLEQINDQDYLKEFFNKLFKYAVEIEDIAHKMESPRAKEIESTSAEIKNKLDFMNRLSKYDSFIQIPIRIYNHNTQADIYIFRKKKNKKNYSSSVSALIALDLKNIGHFEAFVQKNQKDIYCQFRLENGAYQNIIQKHAQELIYVLSDKGYHLQSITFHELKEPFHLLKSTMEDSKVQEEPKRYSFDMRV